MRRDSQRTARPGRKQYAPDATQPPWLRTAGYVAIAVVLGVAVLTLARDYLGARYAVPFPQSGAIHWYTEPSDKSRARFTVTAPSGSRLQYAVRLNEWDSGKPVLLVPVRAGETARADVPLGRYRVTIIKGRNWRGPGRYFGAESQIQETIYPLEFFRVGNVLSGHSMLLDSGSAGNLETQPGRR